MAEPEDKMGEGQDKIVKEDDINQDSDDSSNCSFEKDPKRWYGVFLSGCYERNEQVAFLLDVLKCDNSVVPSIYRFCIDYFLEACLTYDESKKFRDFEEVDDISLLSRRALAQNAKRTRSRTFEGPPKKQKTSKGRILSEQRKNKEKWRYDEDLEVGSETEDSEDEDLSDDDDPYRIEVYHNFDESGKRWHRVCLRKGITKDDQKALLRDVLKWDPCKLDGFTIYEYQVDHLFLANMNEKEADEIAGLKEVKYVEPCRFVLGYD